ncbi:MAG: pyridoxamine 5'-phosphate oxidase family protein [Anaerolineaceae bacterium]|nr:pyridoxamine 5'-phosphate oxidase family protein [Anaerolineaceae bacterium]
MEIKRSNVTRHDREVQDESWIVELLQRVPMGTLATASGEQPYQSTLLFIYDPNRRAIYLHTARRGRVWENLRANPRSCFTIAEMGRLLPAETALNFSVEYNSVVIFGNAVLVDDPTEAECALQLILDRYFPHLHSGQDYRPITASERDVTAVYRLEIEEWSGKRKAVPEDFPGAFHYST